MAVEVPGTAGILRLAIPIILANCSAPLLGLVDTAIIGNTGSAAELGGIAIGAVLLNFVYWGFGFLRMGTTGFMAAADGAGDEAEVRAVLGRAITLGAPLGLALLVLREGILGGALGLVGATPEVEAVAASYFRIRIWGAPASLATFAIMGAFIGLGRTGHLLILQLFLNGWNVALDLLFAGVLGWGAKGIALGTALSEWLALGLAIMLAVRLLARRRRDEEPFVPWERIIDRKKLLRTLGANSDIMIRTLLMLFAFAWFTDQSARFGNLVVAANHILLQFVSFSAFFLDGYAHAAEPLVGRSFGAGRTGAFDAAVRRSSLLAAVTACGLAVGMWGFGELVIHGLTDLEGVREMAIRHLPWAALYVLCSFAAFQLDGIFIGASRTRDMRNASVLSVVMFLTAAIALTRMAGNDGLWLAFIGYVIVRAVTLGLRYPALRRSVAKRGGLAVAGGP